MKNMVAENDLVVHYVPKGFRPIQDSPECDDNDNVTVTFVGESFMYIIPSYDVIAVELKTVTIKGNSRKDGME